MEYFSELRIFFLQKGLTPSSGISPASFFATAAALIQNKAALEMRNRAHLLQSSRSEQRDLRSTPDHLNLLSQGEYHHMPSKLTKLRGVL